MDHIIRSVFHLELAEERRWREMWRVLVYAKKVAS
jgi:hypothetical protein